MKKRKLTETQMQKQEEAFLTMFETEKKSMMDAAETIATLLELNPAPFMATIGHAYNLILGTFNELMALRREAKREAQEQTGTERRNNGNPPLH